MTLNEAVRQGIRDAWLAGYTAEEIFNDAARSGFTVSAWVQAYVRNYMQDLEQAFDYACAITGITKEMNNGK